MNTMNQTGCRDCQIDGVGVVRGALIGDIAVFRGIPFAAAPVGLQRFRPPEPAPSWRGVRDTTGVAPIAPQTPSRVLRQMGAIEAPQSEDCLSLTIWKPDRTMAPLPVVVWLHGGGFSTGGGALPWYEGIHLARAGLVVVGVNYRLGALGFLSIPGTLPGNLALLDQLAALDWVKDHIADLGGDPSLVTVMGQSGGGHNIASMLTLPASSGLFCRAILQSVPLGIGLMSAQDAGKRADAFLNALGLRGSTAHLIDELRSAPVSEILRAQTEAAQTLGNMTPGDLRPPFTPTVLEPHSPHGDFTMQAATAAAARRVEILIGWTREEANLFLADLPQVTGLSTATLESLAGKIYGTDSAPMLDQVRGRRPQAEAPQLFMDLVGDANLRLPSMSFAHAVAGSGGRVFVYQFDWASPQPQLGACHCLELPFVFGTLAAFENAPLLQGADVSITGMLSREMMRRWVQFIKTGDPGFPAWQGASQPIYHFDVESRLEYTA